MYHKLSISYHTGSHLFWKIKFCLWDLVSLHFEHSVIGSFVILRRHLYCFGNETNSYEIIEPVSLSLLFAKSCLVQNTQTRITMKHQYLRCIKIPRFTNLLQTIFK